MGQLGHEAHSFEAVEAVLANPYPPGTDPASIRLPSVPRLRTPEDNEENHLAYWRAHLWETLLRYRRAYHDPACTEHLRAGYGEVAETAVGLAERATSGFPLSPIDSVACHTTLKELHAGAVGLEATVVALQQGSGAPAPPTPPPHPTDFTAVAAAPARRTAAARPAAVEVRPTEPDPVEDASGTGSAAIDDPDDGRRGAPLTPDLFARPQPSRSFEFGISLRGARGLRRGRSLAGGGPGETTTT